MKSEGVSEVHYVVKYNMDTKAWEIDWDSIEARFIDGNYYNGHVGWGSLQPEFENPIIQELERKLQK